MGVGHIKALCPLPDVKSCSVGHGKTGNRGVHTVSLHKLWRCCRLHIKTQLSADPSAHLTFKRSTRLYIFLIIHCPIVFLQWWCEWGCNLINMCRCRPDNKTGAFTIQTLWHKSVHWFMMLWVQFARLWVPLQHHGLSVRHLNWKWTLAIKLFTNVHFSKLYLFYTWNRTLLGATSYCPITELQEWQVVATVKQNPYVSVSHF